MLETSGRWCKHFRKLWKFLTLVIKYVFLKQGKSHENSEKIVCSQFLGNSKTKLLATPVGGSTGSIGQRSNFRVAASILTQPHNLSTRLMRFIRQQYYCHTQYSYLFRYIAVAITCIQSITQSTVYWVIGCSKKIHHLYEHFQNRKSSRATDCISKHSNPFWQSNGGKIFSKTP